MAWRCRARRELCNRLCRRAGQPAPCTLESITDLDVERLRGVPAGVGLGPVDLDEGRVGVRVAVARVDAQLLARRTLRPPLRRQPRGPLRLRRILRPRAFSKISNSLNFLFNNMLIFKR